MKPSWTPGPWEIEVLTSQDPNGDEWETDIEVCSSSGRHICGHDLGYNDEVDVEIHANARLIAAAPDLLEALEAIVTHPSYAEMQDGETGENCDLIAAGIAAVAKSKGEA